MAPPDPLSVSGVLVPAAGPRVHVLGSALRDDGLELYALSPSADRAGAEQRANVVLAWAAPFLNQRSIHALRIVMRTSTEIAGSSIVVRFGLDAARGWVRRIEPARDGDRGLTPSAAGEADPAGEVDARAAAEAWLALVDASLYGEALASAPTLESRASRQAWTAFLQAVPALQGPRRQLFALHAERIAELPGGPFVLLTLLAETARGGLLETVVLEHHADGWRVVSYDAYEAGWVVLAVTAVS